MGWVSSGAAATGSTVQNEEAGRSGRMIPVTAMAWPAARSREPGCRPNRPAVAWVTATWRVAVAAPGRDPATSRALRPSPLR